MRNEFITKARNSSEERGSQGYYWYNVMPKNNKPDEEDEKKSLVTRALMNTIFANPEYRMFALKIYDILVNKLNNNPYTRQHYHTNIVVQLKGGVAYTYLLERADDIFPYSDLDIVIYINPTLSPQTFKTLKDTVSIIVLQTISQYKRAIDYMFFSNKERMTQEQRNRQSAEQFMSDELIERFKEHYNKALENISGEKGDFVSPFSCNEIRNAASKHSYLITNSVAKDDSVVRVEVPHFESCERIPLRKTPMFCSYNESIRFNRLADPEAGELIGSFDLFRIRFNNIVIFKDEEEEGKMYRQNVTADFVDISIPNQDDAELVDFWNNGRTMMVKDETANIWLVIPDFVCGISDLYKMLNLYVCPEAKREKRQKRYDLMQEIYKSMWFLE